MTEKNYLKVPCNDSCPFLSSLNIKEKKKLVKVANLNQDKVYELHEQGNNEINSFTSIKIENLVIADEKSYEGTFIKLFKTKFLTTLNIYSIKIFVHITEILELNNNKVTLDIVKVGLICKIDEPRKIYDGLYQLIEKKVIAKSRIKDVYYVNPHIIFRGSNRRVLFTHKEY